MLEHDLHLTSSPSTPQSFNEMSCVPSIPPALLNVCPLGLALGNWAVKEKCVVGKDAVSEFGYPCL